MRISRRARKVARILSRMVSSTAFAGPESQYWPSAQICAGLAGQTVRLACVIEGLGFRQRLRAVI